MAEGLKNAKASGVDEETTEMVGLCLGMLDEDMATRYEE